MNREEKKENLIEEFFTDVVNYEESIPKKVYSAIDQAYQYGLQQGKKEAVERFDAIDGEEAAFNYDDLRSVEFKRKKEMLGE